MPFSIDRKRSGLERLNRRSNQHGYSGLPADQIVPLARTCSIITRDKAPATAKIDRSPQVLPRRWRNRSLYSPAIKLRPTSLVQWISGAKTGNPDGIADVEDCMNLLEEEH